jgi:hypothetical protein
LLDVADVVELCGAAHNSTHVQYLVMWSCPPDSREIRPFCA